MPIVLGILGALVIGYLPGAVVFRLPIAGREKRAALWAEERVFWQVLISLVWSLAVVMALAAAGVYMYERLLIVNVAITAAMVGVARGRLLWRGSNAKTTIAAIVPILLLGVAIWRFFPASEQILGGQDPGVYVNEGVAIDRTGALFRRDAVVANVPVDARDLFFHSHQAERYYGLRFMGMFINDPATGEVIVQFPHLFPASVAIGYGLDGLIGATNMVALWATLGILAVYFFGARLIGRLASFFAALVLALNVIEVWYGRYPNTEVVMQALLFGALLAFARAHQDEDRFFAWVAGGLMAVLIFLRFDTFMAIAGMAGAIALQWVVLGRKPRWEFVAILSIGIVLGLAYYTGPMRQYFALYEWNLPSLPTGLGAIAVALVVLWALGTQRAVLSVIGTKYLPIALAVVVVALGLYGLFLRGKVGLLAEHDAYSMRTYRDAYVLWPAMIAALAGYAMVARREFWRDPAFFIVFAGFAFFFFYKIHVVPIHFWMARRFIPVILPGTFLLASGAVFGPSTPEHRRTVRRGVAAAAFMAFIGWQYVVAAKPVAAHREYKGAIRQIEQLAQRFTTEDLVIVESRASQSDLHILAAPLIDIYGLQVLVLESPLPARAPFKAFLTDALKKYERVFVLASGGTDLLSRGVLATPVAFTPFRLPEYETTAWDTYPKGPREKDLGFSIYQLNTGTAPAGGFALDIGYLDDLQTVNFFAREVTEGRTFRWTQDTSFVAVSGLTGNEHELELVLHDGGRPAKAPPATLEVFFGDRSLGVIKVAFGFQSYRLNLPADLVKAAAESPDPTQLRLISSVFRPSDFGGGDTRELGVMIDRVAIH